jgi:hypothetical protein
MLDKDSLEKIYGQVSDKKILDLLREMKAFPCVEWQKIDA